MERDTTISFAKWQYTTDVEGPDKKQWLADGEAIRHNFVAFCSQPLGFYRGEMFKVMSRKAESIAEINECLPLELGHKVLMAFYRSWNSDKANYGYVIRYATIPLVKLTLRSSIKSSDELVGTRVEA